MGKKLKTVQDKIEQGKEYVLEDAVKLVRECCYTKFDETVDLAVNLGIDPKSQNRWYGGRLFFLMAWGKKSECLFSQRAKRKRKR